MAEELSGTNLIINGDFEDSPVQGDGYGFFDSITGWQSTFGQLEIQSGNAPNQTDMNISGNSVLELASEENVGIQQTVTVAEGTEGVYRLRLEHAERRDDRADASFNVIVDGEVVATVTTDTPGATQVFEIDLPLTDGTHTIAFAETGQNDGFGSILDNVSLIATGEPLPNTDVPQDIEISLADTSIAEDGSTLATITRTGDIGIDAPLTVTVSVSGGDEAAPTTTEVTFAANQTTQTVQINGLTDGTVDGDQAVTVTATSGSLSDSASLTVTDVDAPPLNIITGNEFGNVLVGTSRDDDISGLGGNDFLIGAEGNDILRGGDGARDFALYGMITNGNFVTEGVVIDMSTGNVQNDGHGTSDTLIDVEGVIVGSEYNDTFIGSDAKDEVEIKGGGNDVINLNGGNDNLYLGQAQGTYDGGAGFDYLSFFTDVFLLNEANTLEPGTRTTGINVDLSANAILDDGLGNSATATNFEGVVGSTLSDTIIGDDLNNTIDDNRGDDTVDLRGGNDIYYASSGADTITLGSGDDVLIYFSPEHMFGDVITDFEAGDEIRLFEVAGGNGSTPWSATPIYIGNASFTGIAGEVRAFQNGSSFIIEVDNNGDGNSDGALTLQDVNASNMLFSTLQNELRIESDAALQPTTNLIINGDFEDSPVQGDGYGFFDSITGWQSTFGQLEIQSGDAPNQTDMNLSGNNVLELASEENVGIQQTVTAAEGTEGIYRLRLEHAERRDDRADASFNVIVDGEVVATVTTDTPGATQVFEIDLPLTDGTHTIAFAETGQNDGFGSILDNVSLIATGEPLPNTDVPQDIEISLADTSIAEDGSTLATITRTGDIGIDAPLTVTVSVSGGDEAAPTTTEVTFAANQTTQTVQINGLTDSTVDGDQAVTVTATSGSLSADANLTVTDIDTAPPLNIILGTEQSETLNGTDGDDDISGLGGQDHISGGKGNDILRGGEGPDYAVFGYALYDDVNTQAISINLSTGIVLNDGHGTSDSLFGIEEISIYSSFGDTILGSDGTDRIGSMGGGDDFFNLKAGNDIIALGKAQGTYDGGEGFDSLFFSDGVSEDGNAQYISLRSDGVSVDLSLNMVIDDGEGNNATVTNFERLYGTSFSDVLIGDSNENVFYDRAGDDIIDLGGGDDLIFVGSGNDTITLGEGNDRVSFTTADSLIGDIITDFEDGDTIYFNSVNAPGGWNAAPSYIGDAAFDGTLAQVRSYQDGNNLVIEIDDNGDGVSDGTLTLQNVSDVYATLAPEWGGFILNFGALPEPTTNLIINGDFEDNDVTLDGNGTGWGIFSEITGWRPTVTELEIQEGANPNSDLGSADNAVLELAPNYNDGVEQTVTVPEGDEGIYRLSLQHAKRLDDASDATFQIIVDGEIADTVTTTVRGTTQDYSIDLPLTSDTHTIELREVGSFNDGKGTLIDNVSLIATGEPLPNTDVPQDIEISLAETSIAEDGSTLATITRTGDIGIDAPLTVTITVSGGDEAAPTTTEVTFAANQTTQTVQINGLTDGTIDGDQAVIVTATSGSLSADANLIVTDIDTPPPLNIIIGTEVGETLNGTDGNDDISGLGGDDIINGGRGDDILRGGESFNDQDIAIYGDHFSGDRLTEGVEINLSTGEVQNDGYGTTDTLTDFEFIVITSEFDDTVEGSSSNEGVTLRGAGNDVVNLDAGNDSLYLGQALGIYDGGEGYDTLGFFTDLLVLTDANTLEEVQRTNGVTVDLSLGMILDDGLGNAASATSFEGFAGTRLNDTLIGTDLSNSVNDGEGDDIVDLRGGNDGYIGSLGADTITLGEGDDNVFYLGDEEVIGDIITDFELGDEITLIDITSNGLASWNALPTYIGDADFTGVSGEFRSYQDGNNLIIEFDDNGDGQSDGILTLQNVSDIYTTSELGSNRVVLNFGSLPDPSTNLIINGDFEDSPVQGDGYGFFDSITGWTATLAQFEIQSGQTNVSDISGPDNSVLELDSDRNAGIQQTVTVAEGQEGIYRLRLDHSQRTDDNFGASLQVIIDGVVVRTVNAAVPGATEVFEIDLPLTEGQHTIGFTEVGNSDGIGTLVDNVTLIATGDPLPPPPPADTISFDGIAESRIIDLGEGMWAAPLRVLPLGDSITHGIRNGPADDSDGTVAGYRDDLWDKFVDRGILIDYVGTRANGPASLLDDSHEGTSGIRADQIANELGSKIGSLQPDVVLLMAGTNDSYQDNVNSGVTTPQDLQNIINIILNQNSNTQIYVATLPPQDPALPRNAAAADALAEANQGIINLVASLNAEGKDNIHLVRTDDFSLDLISDVGPGGFNDVGLHPTDEGYAELASRWFDAILDNFNSEGVPLTGPQTAISSEVQNAIGSSSNDYLIGDDRANTLEGRGGNDILDGGAGNDILTGGAGRDIFIFSQGDDTITDFTGGSDLIDLTGTGITSLSEFMDNAFQQDDDVVFNDDLGGTSTTTLEDVDIFNFTDDMFIFDDGLLV